MNRFSLIYICTWPTEFGNCDVVGETSANTVEAVHSVLAVRVLAAQITDLASAI
jgi:hypothetical protein